MGLEGNVGLEESLGYMWSCLQLCSVRTRSSEGSVRKGLLSHTIP